MKTDHGNTIAAISTPLAAGGIAMIRISGEKAIEIAQKIFIPAGKPLNELNGYSAAYGHFTDNGETFDDGVAVIYKAPHSYTGENVSELCCHGGVFLAQKVLKTAVEAGACPAQPGEFTRRAFENGKLSLTQAESVVNLISAVGDSALKEANAAKSGALAKKIDLVKTDCINAAADVAAFLEYPDEDVPAPVGVKEKLVSAIGRCEELIRNFDNGQVWREGLKTVIAGKPNVGKSAIMNLLAGCPRCLVTAAEGTTRDVVTESVRLGSVLLNLADTAGIRLSDDEIERLGIEKTKSELETAQLVLAVFDGAQKLDGRDREVIRLCKELKTVCVINKNDLPQIIEQNKLENEFKTIVNISAFDENAVKILEEAIKSEIGAAQPQEGIFNVRQRDCLKRAKTELEKTLCDLTAGITADATQIGIEAAISALCELTGENVPETLIDEIFSRFCLGK
ncbi:MAG TPA: tRNA uridine-5-carboxymethylaminomethyl(34) synthesis GTPase MnmE [Oscillospiraceae bacterium]|nr:tRNA uridine-5-carboxymethylaminomethyl(34) synthesis GTPase MnmE [Oscillospiraceae bacterium]HPS34547.1 tRNA uridine-5-carboxymethylaminomethyl(34) synthesis GTPase MnmE [Oscillospiraceae bacterium]